MSWFLDSSALVKLYSHEDHHHLVEDLLERDRAVVVSSLARVEVPSALWRKHRTGALEMADVAALLAAFEADWYGTSTEEPRVIPIASRTAVLTRAASLTGVHGLRSLDAIQLASALAARSVDRGVDSFLAFDRELCAAAVAEGFDATPFL